MKKLNLTSSKLNKVNLILIHGWGFNSKIWNTLIESKLLNMHFKIYTIDLPGFGNNSQILPMTLNHIAKLFLPHIPKKSILLGWSMGGLVTNTIGLNFPKKIIGIINISSSPCFIKRKNWPGITKESFFYFYNQFKKDFKNTIYNFLLLNAKNVNNIKIKSIKKNILRKPIPTITALKKNLKIIISSDLRFKIKRLNIPMLRIYGNLDKLVPKEICSILDKMWPNTQSIIINNSAHIPFISHLQEFLTIIINFKKYLNSKKML
ncbi:MAG: pimeloyl-ACP methyl ester esterase BioH [Buchnera aphidicola (Chaetogeoica yunlongensis)]